MPSTYILEDQKEKIYIGSCINLESRFLDHLRGNTLSTKNFINPKIAWRKDFDDLKEARACERKIKKWKSRKMINFLIVGEIKL